MTQEKKTVYKNLGWIALGIAVLIVLFYFITAYGAMANEGYVLEDFSEKKYRTQDRMRSIEFNAEVDAATVITEEGIFKLNVELKDNIFLLTGSEEFEFIIIDSNTLFGSVGDTSDYFYR